MTVTLEVAEELVWAWSVESELVANGVPNVPNYTAEVAEKYGLSDEQVSHAYHTWYNEWLWSEEETEEAEVVVLRALTE